MLYETSVLRRTRFPKGDNAKDVHFLRQVYVLSAFGGTVHVAEFLPSSHVYVCVHVFEFVCMCLYIHV